MEEIREGGDESKAVQEVVPSGELAAGPTDAEIVQTFSACGPLSEKEIEDINEIVKGNQPLVDWVRSLNPKKLFSLTTEEKEAGVGSAGRSNVCCRSIHWADECTEDKCTCPCHKGKAASGGVVEARVIRITDSLEQRELDEAAKEARKKARAATNNTPWGGTTRTKQPRICWWCQHDDCQQCKTRNMTWCECKHEAKSPDHEGKVETKKEPLAPRVNSFNQDLSHYCNNDGCDSCRSQWCKHECHKKAGAKAPEQRCYWCDHGKHDVCVKTDYCKCSEPGCSRLKGTKADPWISTFCRNALHNKCKAGTVGCGCTCHKIERAVEKHGNPPKDEEVKRVQTYPPRVPGGGISWFCEMGEHEKCVMMRCGCGCHETAHPGLRTMFHEKFPVIQH